MKEFKPNFEISKEDARNLEFALKRLYFHLARVNSVRGRTVGAARLMAMAQVESRLRALAQNKPNSPAVKYLLHAAMKRRGMLNASIRRSHKFNMPAAKPIKRDEKAIVKLADRDGTSALDSLRVQINAIEKRHLQKTIGAQERAAAPAPKAAPEKVEFVLRRTPEELLNTLPPELTEEKWRALKQEIWQRIMAGLRENAA